jgi:FG-GAP-like repeat
VGESALKVVDLDGTPPAEIIVGDSQWGSVTAYRYNSATGTASSIAQVAAPGDGVSAVAAGDVNHDGKMELVFGSDYYSSGRDYLTIASWTPAPAVLWNGPTAAQLDGPFYGAKMARLSPTSQQLMFLTAGTDSGYGGTRVISIDPTTGAVAVSNEVDSNWSHDPAFNVGDVLGTGIDQMLIGTATFYTDYFTAYDFASNTKTWSSGTLTGGGVAVVHADLNKDNIDDLVGITTGGYVYAYDAAHQNLIWSSTGLNSGIDVAVYDLDGDGTPEIIALSADQLIVYARSGSTYLQQASYAVTGTSLLVADTNGDGKPEIYVLAGSLFSTNSMVYQLDNTLKLLNSYTTPYATSLFLEQSAFGRKNLVLGTGNSYYTAQPALLDIIDPSSGTIIWASPPLLGNVSRHSLGFYDLNGDGQLEMTIGTAVGMYITQ